MKECITKRKKWAESVQRYLVPLASGATDIAILAALLRMAATGIH